MKILYIAEGDCIHLKRRLNLLKKQPDLQISLLTESSSGMSDIDEHIIRTTVGLPFFRFFFKYLEIKKVINQVRPDIVHIISAHPLHLLATFTRFKPIIISCWGGDVLRAQGARNNPIYNYIFNHAIKRASKILCVSEEIKNEIDMISPGKSVLFPFGVDMGVFNLKQNTELLKGKYGLNKEELVIFSPRGLASVYNIPTILQAFSEVKKKIGNVKLILNAYVKNEIGKNQLDKLKVLAKQLNIQDDIIYKHYTSDSEMSGIYGLSDLVLSVPFSDGMPVSVIEAMACKVPIICSRLPSLSEILANDENTLFVNPGDPEELTKNILRLLKDRAMAERFVEANYKIVKDKFNMNDEINKMISIYRDSSSGDTPAQRTFG